MKKQINFDIEAIGVFRKAKPEDIVEGGVVFLVGDGEEMHKKTIEEVYNKNDEWKAFGATDGCIYGLYDLWVLKSNNDLQRRIDYLETIVENIKKTLKNF